uniref:Deoxyribose-phosphate aldolase n=2 Tax=candidate division WOR-3 bacterium TaxID=2052148 RepID=A0A7V3ZYC4_UNCW3
MVNFEEIRKIAERIEKGEFEKIEPAQLAKMIDHTNLNAFATKADIEKLVKEALEYGFFSVCVNPVNVKLAKELTKGSDVKVCSVVGFPLGQNTMELKIREAERAVEDGADEIDMVINIGKLKENDVDYVSSEIAGIKRIIGDKILKVIIETCYLEDDEKVLATKLCVESGADFVKTSTGFGKGGATVYDVLILHNIAADKIKVKAAGGIRTYEDALKMIKAGASRLGASRSVEIVKGTGSSTGSQY